jgi:hypothetical protein
MERPRVYRKAASFQKFDFRVINFRVMTVPDASLKSNSVVLAAAGLIFWEQTPLDGPHRSVAGGRR